ncbi:PE_PGRS protein, putative [Trichomonas vaginalis G3]|uniref:receptor protein-tyrosine kinase n=1 Tax=Trichomonas vaginalis (strain ATCC PRA-98 / G3) TaxID=412133 RepID=A2DD98_TRIV3|nr:glycine-rich protein family [Trichomonas vaginalis G3]EAY21577.1 PE_PGRS protein, putative [Trichomonas vaginalis G3]KAI5489749.1 glycine-rich protein family [Trichomonas vaginalis G3]|eukprot:XP_001582563.1 PE_PGRS protein [Trichomonas vaginalis G3]
MVRSIHGNTQCRKLGSRGGAGGYISGYIKLDSPVTAYATIGGKGNYSFTRYSEHTDADYLPENLVLGGYGGGGAAANFYGSITNYGAGSGGGQTAVKFKENDLWHRVIVSGAGGGSDNHISGLDIFSGPDDGSGGAGGGLEGQGFWIDGNLTSDFIANSTFGFTFGFGETAQKDKSKSPFGRKGEGVRHSDRAGAGSGWFGGFASHSGNGGAGGGSSWALTKDAIIPTGPISSRGTLFLYDKSLPYAFTKESGYLFEGVTTYPGVWDGNGRLVIQIVDENELIYAQQFKVDSAFLSIGFSIHV